MKFTPVHTLTFLLILAGTLSIAWWMARDPVADFVTSEPGLDNRGEGAVIPDIDIGAFFETYAEKESDLAESWPRFRGAGFDNISTSPVKLLDFAGCLRIHRIISYCITLAGRNLFDRCTGA